MDQNLSKIIKHRGLEGSGAGLEASWAVLGDPKRLWRHLGLSWKRLGGVLEGSWRPLGRSWAEKGGQHGSKLAPQIGAQIDLKSIPKIDQLFVPLGIDFYKDFAGLCPNGTKLSQKRDQNLC